MVCFSLRKSSQPNVESGGCATAPRAHKLELLLGPYDSDTDTERGGARYYPRTVWSGQYGIRRAVSRARFDRRNELSPKGTNYAPPTYMCKVLSSTRESSSQHTFRVWGCRVSTPALKNCCMQGYRWPYPIMVRKRFTLPCAALHPHHCAAEAVGG